jgi:hypothetical protein
MRAFQTTVQHQPVAADDSCPRIPLSVGTFKAGVHLLLRSVSRGAVPHSKIWWGKATGEYILWLYCRLRTKLSSSILGWLECVRILEGHVSLFTRLWHVDRKSKFVRTDVESNFS